MAPEVAAAAAISSDTQRSGESSSPDELLEGGKCVGPSPVSPTAASESGSGMALPWGALDSACQQGLVSGRKAAYQSSWVPLASAHRAHPTALGEQQDWADTRVGV